MSLYHPRALLRLNIRFYDNDEKKIKYESFTVQPLTLKISVNTYYKADKITATVDYASLPLDPRSIRAIVVSAYIWDALSLQADMNTCDFDDPVFIGFIDKESINLGKSQRVINMEGRDYTCLFLDAPWDKPEGIDVNKPIDQVIEQIINYLPSAQNIKLDVRTKKLANLGQIEPDFFEKKKTGGKRNRRTGTYWDIIQLIAKEAALIVYMELDKLVIANPSDHWAGKDVYQMVYGYNGTDLKLEREIGKHQKFNIRVRSLNFSAGVKGQRVLTVDIPRQADDAWCKKMGIVNEYNGEKVDNIRWVLDPKDPDAKAKPQAIPFTVFFLNNRSEEELKQFGQETYEEFSRQQLSGTIETKDFNIATRKNDTGKVVYEKVTTIKNATPIKLIIDAQDITQSNPNATNNERYEYLKSRGYPDALAQIFSAVPNNYDHVFYCREVTFNFDKSSGFKTSLNLCNYVKIKADDKLGAT